MKKKRIYYWRGLTPCNQLHKSEIIALSLSAARNHLLFNNIVPLTIRKGPYLHAKHFRTYDLLMITRQLTTLLAAGLSLIAALTIMIEEQRSPYWRALLKHINHDINNGRSFSDAVYQFPMSFPKIYQQTIRAAEQTGQLPYCLDTIISALEQKLTFQKKIKQSLRYPIFLGTTTLLVTTYMLFFLLPQFEQIYATFDTTLPWFTLAIIGITHHLQHNSLSIIIFIVLLLFCSYYIICCKYAYQFQYWFLSFPKLGTMLRCHYLELLFQQLMLTQKAAIPLLDGLKITQKLTTSLPYNKALNQISTPIKQGDSLSLTLKNKQLFPSICCQYIRTGEESGSLALMLEKLTYHYQQKKEESINSMITYIEPIMVSILCFIIGSIVLAFYLPIINLGEVI